MTKASKKETTVTPFAKGTDVEIARPSRLMTPFDELDRMFDELMSRGWMSPFRLGRSHLSAPFEGRTPDVDMVNRDDEIFIKAELPGVDKDDVEITLTDRTVTIKGSTRAEEKEEKGDYYRCEISQGSFSRTLSLPDQVDTDKAKAKFKHGVLKLTLPKVKSSKRANVKIE
ncbi:MAG: Hsp20/alpha crystallin family protein [Gammaproteobacteria bacterium]|nr:Hsp20/alpha crystallin family protein [Gammaproteobacteria bacterium]MDH5735367.1 Hsp20/alpha crystallin family protein [Gammaproteobacteria bacterium]